MKRNIFDIPLVIIGALFMIVTLCIYFLTGVARNNVTGWALAFVLLSEVFLFGGLIMMRSMISHHNKLFTSVGIPIVLTLYFVSTTVCALFSGLLEEHFNILILIEIIIFAIAISLIVIVFAFSKNIHAVNDQTKHERDIMNLCEKRIYSLFISAKDKTVKKQLHDLYEIIHYSDKIGLSSVDDKMLAQIYSLEELTKSEEPSGENFKAVINNLSDLAMQRKLEIAELKRGGF